jgi:hypothetical protein
LPKVSKSRPNGEKSPNPIALLETNAGPCKSCHVLLQFLQYSLLSQKARRQPMDAEAGLPDLSWHNVPKLGKINRITTKYTKCLLNKSNSRKIDQISINCTNISHCKNYPNCIFGLKIYHLAMATLC